MNCAVITVSGGARKGRMVERGASDSVSSRQDMFVANVGNGVCTYEGTDVEFPNPGPDVTRNSDNPHAPGEGTCSRWGGN